MKAVHLVVQKGNVMVASWVLKRAAKKVEWMAAMKVSSTVEKKVVLKELLWVELLVGR